MKIYIKLFSFFKEHLVLLILTIFFTVLFSLVNGFSITMVSPFVRIIFGGETSSESSIINTFLRVVEKFVLTESKVESVKRLCYILVFIFALKALLGYLSKFLSFLFQERISRDLRNALFSKFLNLPLIYFSKIKTGALVSRFTHDLTIVRYALSEGLIQFFRELLNVSVYLVIAFWASPILTLVSLIIFPFAFLFIQISSKVLRRRAKRAQERMGEIGSRAQEILLNLKIVKSFVRKKEEIEKFKSETERFYKAHVKYERLSILTPHLTELVGAIMAALMLYIGGVMIFNYKLLAPDRFFIFIAAALSILQPLKGLTLSYANLQQGITALNRTFDILKEKEEKSGKVLFNGLKKGIEFRNVSFYYEKDRWVLRNINLVLEKGKVYAFVGPSGAGKSTLLSLLPRFYDPQEGEIFIDGVNLREFDLDSLRSKIGVVTQDVSLFSGTIRDNLLYGNPDAGEDDLKRALEMANLSEFVAKLPKGIDTDIKELGKSLSGGERQRLSIARVFVKNPDILILDEFTSQLDAHSEHLIKEAIYNLFKGRTALVIAHRLSTILRADEIILMDQGKILDRGKHEELLKRSTLYSKLYELQFEKV
ncbi:MAG: ABC transporter ATP-binding protein [Candidatus Hydrothermales bacterium]